MGHRDILINLQRSCVKALKTHSILAVKSTLYFAKGFFSSLGFLTAYKITVVLSGKVEWETRIVIGMRPPAGCTGLTTMAFITCLPFFSLDKLISSSFLLCLTIRLKKDYER